MQSLPKHERHPYQVSSSGPRCILPCWLPVSRPGHHSGLTIRINPLQNLLAVVRRRTQANQATYACFSMPQKHTTRNRTLCCSTASFSAALWVQCSPSWWHCTRRRPAGCVLGRPCPLPSRCNVGLRKGCPPSPLLYAIFINPLLQDMQSLSHPDMLWVGPPTSERKLVGQAYADDLAGIAATQQGLQRVVDTVHAHSLRWVGRSMCTSRW